jgi:hypothetical protein
MKKSTISEGAYFTKMRRGETIIWYKPAILMEEAQGTFCAGFLRICGENCFPFIGIIYLLKKMTWIISF